MDELTKESRLEAIKSWQEYLHGCMHDMRDLELEYKVAELQRETCIKRSQMLAIQIEMAKSWLLRLGVKLPPPTT